MKATKHIIRWMEEMVNKYPLIYYKYEYSNKDGAHLICEYPTHITYECEAYCEEQMVWLGKMDKLFPEETILFSDEEDLFSCSAKALEIHHHSLLVEED